MNLGSFRLGGTRMRMLACLALLPLTGCGMTGKWALVSVDPDAARRDVEFHSMTLQKDGSFYAESAGAGLRTTSGTYTYEEGVLNFRAHDGETHTYDAKLEHGAQNLCLERFWEGQKVKMTYERRD